MHQSHKGHGTEDPEAEAGVTQFISPGKATALHDTGAIQGTGLETRLSCQEKRSDMRPLWQCLECLGPAPLQASA